MIIPNIEIIEVFKKISETKSIDIKSGKKEIYIEFDDGALLIYVRRHKGKIVKVYDAVYIKGDGGKSLIHSWYDQWRMLKFAREVDEIIRQKEKQMKNNQK